MSKREVNPNGPKAFDEPSQKKRKVQNQREGQFTTMELDEIQEYDVPPNTPSHMFTGEPPVVADPHVYAQPIPVNQPTSEVAQFSGQFVVPSTAPNVNINMFPGAQDAQSRFVDGRNNVVCPMAGVSQQGGGIVYHTGRLVGRTDSNESMEVDEEPVITTVDASSSTTDLDQMD